MKQLQPLQWTDYLFLYGFPTLLNYIACQIAIPYLGRNSSLPIEIVYFICVGGMVLVPMFFMAIFFSKKESASNNLRAIFERMRIKRLSKKDWVYTVASFVLLSLSSFLIAKILMPKLDMNATPFFFRNMPLSDENRWILYAWPIFFFFNIFGEEFYWRGYIQPRQELQLGKWTWLVHGIFWAVWHLPMGLDLVLASAPIFFFLPLVVQLRKNTSIAIVVHAVFGAFGFLALALGAVK